MRILFGYVAILFVLAPMIVYATEPSMTMPVDSAMGSFAEYDISDIILESYFDEDFQSVVFKLSSSSESEILSVHLDTNLFGYPADLDGYYVLADAEPINVPHEILDSNYENRIHLMINVESGVTSVEIFGKISNDAKPAEEEMEDTEKMEELEKMEDTEKMEELEIKCDAGMIMVNGQCMLDEKPVCGANTVFDGEKCILESQKDINGDKSNVLNFKDLIYGTVGGVIIALAVAFVFLAMSKAFRKN